MEQARADFLTKRRLSFQPEPDGETGKQRHRLHFEQEVLPKYGPPSLPDRVGGTVKTAAVMKFHSKIHESERQNVAVEAAHKSELFAEQGVGRRFGGIRTAAAPSLTAPCVKRSSGRHKKMSIWRGRPPSGITRSCGIKISSPSGCRSRRTSESMPRLRMMQGDFVEWRRLDGHYDRVYKSRVFTDTYSKDTITVTN